MALVIRRSRAATRLRAALVASLIALGLMAPGPIARAEVAPEYQVKAAYLYYFATFVDWPAQALERHPGSLVIGILGADPFGSLLEETLRGKTAHDRRFVVKRFTRVKDALDSHILFVCASEEERLPLILKALEGAQVLTIGETDGFAERGGQIGLRTEGGKVRFQVNVAAAEQAGLRISSQLLKLGTLVASPRAPGG